MTRLDRAIWKHLASAFVFLCLMLFLLVFEFWLIGVVQVNRAEMLHQQPIIEAWNNAFIDTIKEILP